METDNRIEALLEKYFEGETNLSEEKLLKTYFNSSEVAEHLQPYVPFFKYNHAAKTEQTELAFSLPVVEISDRKKRFLWVSIAASIVVLLGIGFYAYQQTESVTLTEDYGTCQTPEEAFEQTQKALQLVSEHLNTGIASVAYLNTYQESKNKIFKK